MRPVLVLVCALAAGLWVSGCATTDDQLSNTVYATYKITKNLEQDLAPTIVKLNQTTADLIPKVESNDMALRNLQSTLEDTQAKINALQKNVDKLAQLIYQQSGGYAPLPGAPQGFEAQRPSIEPPPGGLGATPGPGPEPEAAAAGSDSGGSNALTDYNAAQRSFYNEDYGAALAQYTAYLQKYPNSRYADGAQFWKADCLRRLGRFEEAVTEYEALRTTYANSSKVSLSLNNEADAHLRLGQTQRAIALLNQLVDNYPNAPEVDLAKKRLRELKGN